MGEPRSSRDLLSSRTALRAGLVAALALVAYAGSVPNGFVFDDRLAIVESPVVQGRVPLGEVLRRDWWGLDAAHTVGTYRPVAVLSLALDWRVGHGQAWVFHLGNVLLHALAAALVYLVWRSIAGERPALLGALLLTMLAAPAEAVQANVGRADLLEAVLLLAGLWAHRRRGAGWALAAAACVLLALGCKESAVLAPLVYVALDWLVPVESRLRARAARLALYGAALLGYLAVRAQAIGSTGLPRTTHALYNPLSVAPTLERVLGAGRLFVERWLAGLLDPFRRLYDCSARACMPGQADDALAWLGVLLLVALLLSPLALRTRAPGAAAALAWACAFFVPVSNLLVPATLTYGERLWYVPLLGGAVALGVGVDALLQRARRPVLVWGVLGLVLAVNLVALQLRHVDWHDERALYRSGLKYGADSVVVQQNNATVELDAGDLQSAEAHARRAVALVDVDPYAHKILAVVLHAEGRNAEAEREFRRAMELTPSSDIVADFAGFLARQRRYEDALQVVLSQRRVDPTDARLQDLEKRLRSRLAPAQGR